MNKLILIGLIVTLIFLIGWVGYSLGFSQNVSEATYNELTKWCEVNNTTCINYCNTVCHLNNLNCANPDYNAI